MTLEGAIYDAIVAECEEMERSKAYQGNGHHLAQRLAKKVAGHQLVGDVILAAALCARHRLARGDLPFAVILKKELHDV